MRRRGAGITVLVLASVLAAGISTTIGWRPFIGPRSRPLTDRPVVSTPAMVERGKYLVDHVTGCVLCHSELDTSGRGLPVKAGLAGAGRNWAGDGLPWLTAPNITPDPETGLGSWTDDGIARAVREGIGHDGRALFPIMPYANYRRMPDEDLDSIIAYLRTLPAVRRQLPASEVPFPVSRFINDVPEPLTEPVPAPRFADAAARGEHLVAMASCGHCHTPQDERGQPVPGMPFAGGNPFQFEGRQTVASANLTPAPSGIPYYTDSLFLEVIRTGRVRDREISDLMPWGHYRGMSDEDLTSIFAYLRTLAPVEHYVDNTLAATPCSRCGITHGGGERNKKG